MIVSLCLGVEVIEIGTGVDLGNDNNFKGAIFKVTEMKLIKENGVNGNGMQTSYGVYRVKFTNNEIEYVGEITDLTSSMPSGPVPVPQHQIGEMVMIILDDKGKVFRYKKVDG